MSLNTGAFAIFGGAILFMIIAFTMHAFASLSPPPTNRLFGLLPFVALGVFCFVQAYGLWHLRKWSLYTTAALTFVLWAFALFSFVTNPESAPVISVFSLSAGGFSAYLYSVREHFK